MSRGVTREVVPREEKAEVEQYTTGAESRVCHGLSFTQKLECKHWKTTANRTSDESQPQAQGRARDA